MGDREPVERSTYRTFADASDFVNFMHIQYGELVTGFGLTQGPVDSYDVLRRFWCDTRGVEDGNIEQWLMDRLPRPESGECADMDTEHAQVFALIDQLSNPEQFFTTMPILDFRGNDKPSLMMPPAVYVRDLLEKEARI